MIHSMSLFYMVLLLYIVLYLYGAAYKELQKVFLGGSKIIYLADLYQLIQNYISFTLKTFE